MNGSGILRALVTAGLLAGSMAVGQDKGQDKPAVKPSDSSGPAAEKLAAVIESPEAVLAMIENPHVAKSLGLTEEQKKFMQQTLSQHRKEMTRLRGTLSVAATEQARLASADKPDTKAIMSAVEDCGRIRTEMARQAMKNFLELRAKLTPEQEKKLRDVVKGLHDRRREELQKHRQENAGRGRKGPGPAVAPAPQPPPPPAPAVGDNPPAK